MTDVEIPYEDPTTRPFWEAAVERRLVVQRCTACGHHQFYPRPFCLACQATDLGWAECSGGATVYSQTEVGLRVLPGLEPPYLCAVVQLDEGPRLTTNIVGGATAIGDRVRVAWREREGLPPVPVFEPASAPVADQG